jgi:general secretion pathway protein D
VKEWILSLIIAGFAIGPFTLLAQEPPAAPPPVFAPPPAPPPVPTPPAPPAHGKEDRLVSLDFDNVDLPVLIKFIGELTGKNFVLDEQVRGKVTIFSPVKIPASKAYDVFLSVLDLKGFTVVPDGAVYQILPAAASPPPRATHMYTLENTEAEEISKVLTGLVGRAGAIPIRPKSKPAKEIAGNVQMVVDKATNRLIVIASDEDYKLVEEMIKQLDIKRRQVYVEAVILELSSEKLRELGTDLGAVFGFVPSQGSDLAALGSFNQADPTGLLQLGAALVGGVLGTSTDFEGKKPINARAFLHALQSTPETNVLSTPQILTSDRQKAEIVVGQNVPFPGASSQTTGGNVQTTIERKDVGMTLRLTPTVMEKSMVKLDIFQEISSLAETASVQGNATLGPTTNKRTATTNVIVRDGQTAVIGGLTRDNIIVSTKSIPFLFLDKIPIVNWFFKKETRRVEKTNLMIFITPYIVPEEEGRNSLTELRQKKVGESLQFMKKNKVELDTGRKDELEKMINLPK